LGATSLWRVFTELRELALGLHHAGEDAFGDRPEVVLVELVALGRLGAEQRPSRRDEVGTLEVVLLVDQEVLLLGADRREDPRRVVVAEQAECPDRRLRQGVHRAQQRDLRVQRLAGPGHERRRDAEQRTVGILEEERRGRRVPGRVAARLEGRADAAGREGGGVRLTLDELLAGELGDRASVAGRRVERVVLLGGHPGQGLEPVREVRGAPLQRPVLHRLGDRVGQRGVERLTAFKRGLQRLENMLGQTCALHLGAEDVGAEDLVAGNRQVRRAERPAVGAPLRGRHVLLPDSGHGPPRGNAKTVTPRAAGGLVQPDRPQRRELSTAQGRRSRGRCQFVAKSAI